VGSARDAIENSAAMLHRYAEAVTAQSAAWLASSRAG
jgi:hypothetical protein